MIRKILLISFLFCSNILLSQSDCSNAVDYGAVESPSQNANLDSGQSYWYSFTTDGSIDKIEISTCGSSFDTVIDLYASCNSNSSMVRNDNACGSQSIINYSNLSAGTYFVKITANNNESGSFVLSIKTPSPPLAPQSLFTEAFDDSVKLSWSNVSNASKYGTYQVVDSTLGMTCEEQGLKSDCDGNCFSMDVAIGWLGDGVCDSGLYGVNFNCALYNFDEGDCTSGKISDDRNNNKPSLSFLSKYSESITYVFRGFAQDSTKTFSGFYPEKNLSFVVTAVNAVGESDYSTQSKITTPPPYAGQTCEIASEVSEGSYQTLGKKQYFIYNASADVKVKISSNNSDSTAIWDTNLEIYSDCSLDSLIIANDDCCGQPGPSELSFQADSGSSYIILWSNIHRPGPFTFTLNPTELVKSVKPTSLIATSDGNSVQLNWESQVAASSYNIYSISNINSIEDTIFISESFENNILIENLEYETKYTFSVSALGYNGESELSEPVSIFTGDLPPPPYFNPIWPTGGPLDPMYFSIDSAKYDDKIVSQGWEIGIFDDTLLVGSLVLDNVDNNGFSITSSADDTTTIEHDGFRSDSVISFKLFNNNFMQEGIATPTFSINNLSTFKRNSSTRLSLAMDRFGAKDCAFDIPEDWTFDPNNFNYSMNITAELFDNNTALNDTLYTLAAFINGEPRGLSRVQYISEINAYQVRISVFSNNTTNEVIRFQLFNGAACVVQPVIKETVNFIANGFAGSAATPIQLHATDDRLIKFNLIEGKNEISFNILRDDMTLNNLFNGLEFTNGDQIKTLSGFAQFSDDLGWEGTLNTLEIATKYNLNVTDSKKLLLAGRPVNFKTTEIFYKEGWNWIGYLPNVILSSSDALKNLLGTSSSRIINDDGYLEYVENLGWVGTIKEFHPGGGFLLYSKNSGYFTFAGKSNLAKLLKIDDDIIAHRQDSLAQEKFGLMNPHKYRYNSTIIGEIEFKNAMSNDIYDMVGVYVGSELRGVSRTIYLDSKNQYLSFLQIYSNNIADEDLKFRTYNNYLNELSFLEGTLPFKNNQILGTINEPVLFGNSLVDPQNLPTTYELDQNYPNPFNIATNIDYSIKALSDVKIYIYNIKGQVVKKLVEGKESPGLRTISWDGTNVQGKPMPSGVYVVVMEAKPITDEINFDSFRKSKKILYLK